MSSTKIGYCTHQIPRPRTWSWGFRYNQQQSSIECLSYTHSRPTWRQCTHSWPHSYIPSSFSNITFPLLSGTSDHWLISFLFFLAPSRYPILDAPFGADSTDWDGFRDFMTFYPWKDCCFSSDVSLFVSNFTECFPMYISSHSTLLQTRQTKILRVVWARLKHAWKTAYRRCCRSLNQASRKRFVKARNKCTHTIRRAIDRLATKLDD